MGTVEFQTRPTFDRRIGRRVEVDAGDVTWVVARTGHFGVKKRPLEVPGQILDVSITGAGVLGPADLPLELGAVTLLRYGVEISRAHPSLERRIHAILSEPVLTSIAAAPSTGPTVIDLTD